MDKGRVYTCCPKFIYRHLNIISLKYKFHTRPVAAHQSTANSHILIGWALNHAPSSQTLIGLISTSSTCLFHFLFATDFFPFVVPVYCFFFFHVSHKLTHIIPSTKWCTVYSSTLENNDTFPYTYTTNRWFASFEWWKKFNFLIVAIFY